MTKKDYIKLARIIKGGTVYHNEQYLNKQSFIESLCEVLREDNPRFDEERFIKTCNS